MVLKGKTAIITGGGSGLGEAVAIMLNSHGANTVIVDIHEENGKTVEKQLGKTARFIRTDITVTADVQAAVDAAVEQFGGIDILVNCAGIAPGAKIVGKKGPHDLELFKRTMNVNLIGTFDMMRLVASAMHKNQLNEENERGVIINTASIAAFEGQIGQAAYAASKAAIVGLTLPVARDLAEEGIRVCTIAPGLFETPIMAEMPEQVRINLGKTIPFPPRLGRPPEFSMLVRHIIENPMLNGEVIRLDGALRMAPR